MTAITTRAGKGSTLTWNEVDANFTNLNTDKAETDSPTFTGTVSGITKAMVGLGNVDNTSDVNKPVSIAQQTAIDSAVSTGISTHVGLADPHTQYAQDAQLAASSGSSLIGFLQTGTGAVPRTAQNKMREQVSVKDFGAVGDGITNDTAAIQAAINANIGTVYFPDGEYLVTDSIRLLPGSRIMGSTDSAAPFPNAHVRIHFEPATKRSVFVWATNPSTYVFGAAIEGLTVRGFGAGIDKIIDLPMAYGLLLKNLNGYSGFDIGVKVEYWLDCVVEHCSFQGFGMFGLLVDPTRGYATTTRFVHCYFSQGPTAVYVQQSSINSLILKNTTIETVDVALNQEPGNDVWIDVYLENVPRTDAGGAAFKLGVDGSPTGVAGSCYITGEPHIGWTNGGLGNFPTNTKYIEANYIDNVTVSSVLIQRFERLVSTTAFTGLVKFDGVSIFNVPKLCEPDGIFRSDRVLLVGINAHSMQLTNQAWLSAPGTHLPSIEFPYIDFDNANFYDNQRFRLYNDKSTRKLSYKDFSNNLLQVGMLGAATASSTFNGGRLAAGEVVKCATLGVGNPAFFVSQKYSVDTAVTLAGCSTSSGSPILTGSGAGFFSAFNVDDFITISAGFSSTTFQYRIISKASNSSTITVSQPAASTVVGTVTIQYPAHQLLPVGQQGYRTALGSPVGLFNPIFVGEELLDTTASKWYKSTGLLAANWVALN